LRGATGSRECAPHDRRRDEAIQGPHVLALLDGFATLAMTATRVSAFSRHDAPEVCLFPLPSIRRRRATFKRRRRECRVPEAPAAPCAKGRKHTVVDHRCTGSDPAFPARWCYGFLRALPGDRACLPPSPSRSLLLKDLTPASGRQDHTTSPYAIASPVPRCSHVHRIPQPTSLTIAIRPSPARNGCS